MSNQHTVRRDRYSVISLRSPLPSGETHYSVESGATIERQDCGFVVSRDGQACWTPDSNVVGVMLAPR